MNDVRKALEYKLVNEGYNTLSLSAAIGISYRAFIRFMRSQGPQKLVTELKIKSFVEKNK